MVTAQLVKVNEVTSRYRWDTTKIDRYATWMSIPRSPGLEPPKCKFLLPPLSVTSHSNVFYKLRHCNNKVRYL